MSHAIPTTRFAPSPTGYMHLGNLRTALFNDLLARSLTGRFVLRSEDTDSERSRGKYLVAIERDLAWLGLEHDAGPDSDDGKGPYRQSERGEIYASHFNALEETGKAYSCFCTKEMLERSRRAQRRAGRPPRYAGTCRDLPAAEVAGRIAAGEAATLRFRVDDGGAIEFEDLVRGRQHFELEPIGDFVIRRADGSPSFFFGNAVDDALMGVTHVLRGEDHLANTPRQLCLLHALGLDAPTYGHLPMIVGDDGKPLSKRHGAGNVRELREDGYLPLALLNHLFRLGHACDSGDLMPMPGLVERFDLSHLGKAAARHDPVQLSHWQKLAVRNLSTDEVRAWLEAADAKMLTGVPASQVDAYLKLVGDNLLMPGEAHDWALILFSNEAVDAQALHDGLSNTPRRFFEEALCLWRERNSDFKAWSSLVSERTGARGKQLFQPLRLALSGQAHGPELETIATLMGDARVALRLGQAVEFCGTGTGP